MSWVFLFKPIPLRQTFRKDERLKSRKQIEGLFSAGRIIAAGPFRIYWQKNEEPERSGTRFGFAVSKRKFKNAVDRNKIKRWIFEAVRKHKYLLTENNMPENKGLEVMVVFTGNKLPGYQLTEEKIIAALLRLKEEL